jgi:NAD(P)H dehydrogenase (quinone)
MCAAFASGARKAGYEVDLLDLHREPFEHVFQAGDAAQFGGAPMPADVQAQQARVEAADAIGIVYPVYWWTFPAPLRGWIDRVFSAGWAYRVSDNADKGLLRDRPTRVFPLFGAREETVEDLGYGAAMRRLIDEGTFRYCGLTNLATHPVYDVHDSADNRHAGLDAAAAAGRSLSARGA